jgi:predicted Zn-dependent peptidase
VLQLANGPAATDPDRYAAKILATVLGDVDSGLAEQASLSHYDYQGTGLFMTYMSCGPDAAAENMRRIAEIYHRAETEGVKEIELKQAKSKINSRVVLGSERPRGRLFTVGGNWLQRREYRTVHDDLEAVDAITLDDVTAVLARYPLSTSTTVAIGPLKDLPSPA